jgi:hypothetical protein
MRALLLVSLGLTGCLDTIVPLYERAPADPQPAAQDPQDPAPQDPLPTGEEPDMGPASADDLAPVPQSVQIEGEAGTLTAQFVSADDALASGGKYLSAPLASTAGKSSFAVSIPAAGTYTVWGRVISPTDANNSFHASLDADTVDNDATDDTSTIWDLPIAATWTWVKLNTRKAVGNADVTANLTAGSHTLYLNFREPGVQLDRLIVTRDPAFVPPAN